MADLQIVFADNPQWEPSSDPKVVKEKKSLQSQDKSSNLKKKGNSRMKRPRSKAQKANDLKLGRRAKARARLARAAKKKKNPVKYVATKGRKKISTRLYATKKEVSSAAKKLGAYKKVAGRGYLRKRSKRGRAVSKAIKNVESRLKANSKVRSAAVRKAAALRKKGYKIKKVYVSPKSALAEAYKSVSKRKRKKKTSRKESKVAKKRKSKRKGAKRKSYKAKARRRSKPRRSARKSRRKARVVVLTKKRRSVTIKRRNPALLNQIESYTGFKAEELGSLLIGGAVYGTVDGLAAKYAPAVYAMAAKVPVVGTTVVPAAIGIALKIAGEKLKLKPLSLVGEGIVGAAVVAMGIQASAYLPGVGAGVSGVDFTPNMRGYARDGADFGAVDFTPGMGSQPQLGLEAQLGRDPGSADFGLIPEGLAGDLGVIPEGLGSLG